PRPHHALRRRKRQSNYRRAFRFFGTFAPFLRASERPIAMACLRLLTLRPERPLRSVPALRFFIAPRTVRDAFFEYFLALQTSRLCREQIRVTMKVPFSSR